jgi:predicted lipoprotein with Yx(FWY)xxD motif
MKASIWLGLAGAACLATSALAAPAQAAPTMPSGVHMANGALADAVGKPLYVWDIDTMVGMSHCEGDCAKMWLPLPAPKNAKPMGDWSPISREDGSLQWTYKTKPLYTYSGDTAGGPPTGEKVNKTWHLAH